MASICIRRQGAAVDPCEWVFLNGSIRLPRFESSSICRLILSMLLLTGLYVKILISPKSPTDGKTAVIRV
jgi:hypothetical protein